MFDISFFLLFLSFLGFKSFVGQVLLVLVAELYYEVYLVFVKSLLVLGFKVAQDADALQANAVVN